MPKPKAGENEKDYISRCIAQNIREGLTKEQASGKCYGMWRESKKSEIVKSLVKWISKRILNR